MTAYTKVITKDWAPKVSAFYNSNKKEIAINIQKLWQDTKNDGDFITLFSFLYKHELLHSILNGISSSRAWEDKIVDLLQGMDYDIKIYKDFYGEE